MVRLQNDVSMNLNYYPILQQSTRVEVTVIASSLHKSSLVNSTAFTIQDVSTPSSGFGGSDEPNNLSETVISNGFAILVAEEPSCGQSDIKFDQDITDGTYCKNSYGIYLMSDFVEQVSCSRCKRRFDRD